MTRRIIPAMHSWADIIAAAVALGVAALDFVGEALPARYAFVAAAVAAMGRAWYERRHVAPALERSAAPMPVLPDTTPMDGSRPAP